jgi:hypothetical protein
MGNLVPGRPHGAMASFSSALMTPEENIEVLQPKKTQSSESFLIIWLDSNVYRDGKIQMAIKKLENCVKSVHPMNNYDECEEYLMTYNGNEKIIFIVSNEFDKKIVPNIYWLQSIITIYRYSLDYKIDDTWTQKYENVRDVVYDLNELLQIILRDLVRYNRVDDFNKKRLLRKSSAEHIRSFPTKENVGKDVETHSGI